MRTEEEAAVRHLLRLQPGRALPRVPGQVLQLATLQLMPDLQRSRRLKPQLATLQLMPDPQRRMTRTQTERRQQKRYRSAGGPASTCGDTMTEYGDALLHFGPDQGATPACNLGEEGLAQLRAAERRVMELQWVVDTIAGLAMDHAYAHPTPWGEEDGPGARPRAPAPGGSPERLRSQILRAGRTPARAGFSPSTP